MRYRNSFLSAAFPWAALLGFLLAIYAINQAPMHLTPLDQLTGQTEITSDAPPQFSPSIAVAQ